MTARRVVLAAVLCLGTAGGAGAQSVFGIGGLGTPLSPVDARAQALGGIGVGLLGENNSLANPAEAAGVARRGVAAAFQPTRNSIELAGESDVVGGTRFPLVRIVYPFSPRLTGFIGYGGFLDQTWAIRSSEEVVVGPDTLDATDIFQSTGGISQVQAGLSLALAPTLAVGVAGGFYTGSRELVVTRTFPGQVDLRGFQTRTDREYNAALALVGVQWDPVPVARVGASVTFAGEVEAADSLPGFELPVQAAVGASGLLAPGLLASVGARWAGWGSAGELVPGQGEARDTWDVGGGVEWGGMSLAGRVLPVRLGARYAQLPFPIQGAAAREWAAAAGVGIRLAADEVGPLASVDASLERGSRSDGVSGGLRDSFWRTTVSLSLHGL